jgi:hypothetical protein
MEAYNPVKRETEALANDFRDEYEYHAEALVDLLDCALANERDVPIVVARAF